jgi:hypothetical protein
MSLQFTAGVTRLGWEDGVALEKEKTQSWRNAQKTRRVPQVGCTLCWVAFCNIYFTASEQSITLDAHWFQFLVQSGMFLEPD